MEDHALRLLAQSGEGLARPGDGDAAGPEGQGVR